MRITMAALVSALVACAYAGAAEGGDSLSLRQAVDTALKQNPGLLAARCETHAAQANARGARLLPNPELLVAPTVAGQSGADSAVLVVQPLEINGRREARGRVARYEAQASQAAYLSAERQIVREVKRAYWDVAQAQNAVDLNETNVQFTEALYQAARRQFDVGSAPGAQAMKAQVEMTRAAQDLARARTDLSQAKAVLNVLLGRTPDTPFQLSDELKFTPLDVKTRGSQRPELAQAQALLAARKAEVRLVRTRALPDLALQARQETFGGQYGVAIGATLPLFDWGSIRADRKRAEAEAEAQARRVEAVRNAVSLDAESALLEAKRTEALIREYQQSVMSQAEHLAEMAQKGYKAGANSYLEVLEAQRTLKGVRTEYYAALADHMKAIAQLEWALGIEEVAK